MHGTWTTTWQSSYAENHDIRVIRGRINQGSPLYRVLNRKTPYVHRTPGHDCAYTVRQDIGDLAWYHLIWGDDWGWRRIIVSLLFAVIFGALTFYFLGGEAGEM